MIDYTGQLFINEKDAWKTWNVFLVGESLDNLLLPPPPKPYTENNFRSQTGKQVFIINPRMDARDVQVEFCILTPSHKEYLIAYKSFVKELSDGVVTLRIPFLDEVYSLTVASYLSLGYYVKFGKLSVRFNEPQNEMIEPIFDVLATEGLQFLLTEDGKTIIV